MKSFLDRVLSMLCIVCIMVPCRSGALTSEDLVVVNPEISLSLNPTNGLPVSIETRTGSLKRQWLTGPVRLAVRNEITSSKASLSCGAGDSWKRVGALLTCSADLAGLPLKAVQQFSSQSNAISWEIDFRGEAKRTAYEVTIELPMLSADSKIFTPTERGVMDVAVYPTVQGQPYASIGWGNGRSWVLPLVSVLDPRSDQAITIALPADANIPHMQIGWIDGKTLRITLAHRGMGGTQPSPLKLLMFPHAADYRAVLRAYSEAFPSYFRSPLPRGPYEGSFWYHHIQDHPALDEMARQRVRYIWSSFWFTHLGEYLPDAHEWEPYTYAKWWRFGQTMSDEKINAFVQTMHRNAIGTYAYFNVTEYGGAGGKSGDTAEAARILRERFANALVKNAQGNDIATWEGAMAMNPGPRYNLWPFLTEQVRRHLARLPDIDGFIIDRMDWASTIDHGHDDGLTMIGDKPVANMAVPVGEAVREVCRLSHEKGKRVFINQFYRIEVLRDVDGVCHENDYLPALGYLTPLRPASAWHHSKPYGGDLLQFEAQLKRRLYWALFPQMIAHQFQISQQAPNPRAADLLELYSPLFDTLMGKEQVLLPHCVDVSGANDANLFVNPAGNYIASVTSRVRFISRPGQGMETVVVTLRVPDAQKFTWAHAISADGPVYSARLSQRNGEITITADKHGTSTMLVVGKGPEPAIVNPAAANLEKIRDSLSAKPLPMPPPSHQPQTLTNSRMRIRLTGTHVGTAGPLMVLIDGMSVGQIAENKSQAVFDWTPTDSLKSPPQVTLVAADEGTWFVPERVEIFALSSGGGSKRVATWQPGMGLSPESSATRLCLALAWSEGDIPVTVARIENRDAQSAGHWKNRVGSKGAWIPGITGDAAQNGTSLQVVSGGIYRWPATQGADPRILEAPQASGVQPTCWFDGDCLSLRVAPTGPEPYRLTLYVLDYDRNGREQEIVLSDEFVPLSTEHVNKTETAGGVYLTWTVQGPVNVRLKKTAGANAVLSGVFIDPAAQKGK